MVGHNVGSRPGDRPAASDGKAATGPGGPTVGLTVVRRPDENGLLAGHDAHGDDHSHHDGHDHGHDHDVCLVDQSVLDELGLGEHGVVELTTDHDRSMLSRVSARAERNPQDRTCSLPRSAVRALKVVVGDTVRLRTVELVEARRVVLEPLAPLTQHLQAYEDELGESLAHRQTVLKEGMLVPAKLQDFRRDVFFRVLAVSPAHAFVTDATRVTLRTSMVAPGSAANLVGFEDVGGLSSQIQQIRELVEAPLVFPEVYARLGIEAPRGIILYGPPGVGKTHLARATANEVGAHFVYVNGPEVLSAVHGGTEANLRAVFEEAMEHSPAVVMIDELDSIAPRRGDSSQLDARMGTQLLSLLDGLVSMEDVVVIGTTNRIDSIDPALRRPGRFDREIFVGPADAKGRLEILRIHTREMPLTQVAHDYLPDLAGVIHGYSGADIVDLLREAGLHALRKVVGSGLAELRARDKALADVVVDLDDLLFGLHQTRPSVLREMDVRVSHLGWADVVGQEAAIEALREAVELPLRHWQAYEGIGLGSLQGVVLHGPPGSGKSLLAFATAHESGANIVVLNGPEVFSKWLGQSEEAVRAVFRLARQAAPSIVVLDQLDAVGSRRANESSSSAVERVVNQLLIELDDANHRQVAVIALTNRLDLVDPALLRPGRLGVQVSVSLPDEEARRRILSRRLAGHVAQAGRPIEEWDALSRVARESVGLSGSDLQAVCDRARAVALREADYRRGTKVEEKHLAAAFELFMSQRGSAAESMSVPVEGERNGCR